MSIEIKRSVKPVEYNDAIRLLEKRLEKIINNQGKELIWFLEHKLIYTAGTSFNKSEVLDKSIKVIKTNRGGKITCHAPGQLVCYLVIDLNSIINSLNEFKILSKSDRKNIGIWVTHNNESKKIGAIGIKVKKWVAYHGFSLNINNDLNYFKKIIPCGLDNRKVARLKDLSNIKYSDFIKVLQENLIKNLAVSNYS